MKTETIEKISKLTELASDIIKLLLIHPAKYSSLYKTYEQILDAIEKDIVKLLDK